MNVLHVSSTDLQGRAFNGYNLIGEMSDRDINSSMLVLDKKSDNPSVHQLLNRTQLNLHQALFEIEHKESLDNIVFPWASRIKGHAAFKSADVIHYHLFHQRTFSTFDFANLTQLKPSIWTLHDPWFFTGHCVYPQECKGWLSGCHQCPHLDRPFSISRDTASTHWQIKKRAATNIKAATIVASEWMLSLYESSPIGQQLPRPKLVPFAAEVKECASEEQKTELRNEYAIPRGSTCIFFRNDENPTKGSEYIYEALENLQTSKDISILCVGGGKIPLSIAERYATIQLPWVTNHNQMLDLFSASDIFLMPSLAEAFGLMAIEAMSVAIPVIVFEGTSLPKVTGSPEYGIAIPRGDVEALTVSIKTLIEDDAYRISLGKKAQKFVQQEYPKEKYFSNLQKIYCGALNSFDKVVSKR